MSNVILFLESSRGVYIPQFFAEASSAYEIIDYDMHKDDLEILRKADPYECDQYWEAWERLESNMQLGWNGKVYNLFLDGDLFLVAAGLAYKDAFIHIKCFDQNGNHVPCTYFVEFYDGKVKQYKDEKACKRAIDYRFFKKDS